MFEDSTFESGSRIKTKSGRWMLLTGAINGGILVLLILIPLIYPEALPSALMATILTAPPPPPLPPPPPPPPEVHIVHVQSELMNNQLTAPTKIPHNIQMVTEKEAPPSNFGVAGMEGMGGSANGVMGSMFGSGNGPQVKAAPPKKVNISAGVAIGMLIQKTTPIYPPIAKAARVSGTVILQAVISKEGTIKDLRVVSGPAMLQQSAIDAVRQWRYRPYLLNNEPVEVDTTVNVIFTLGG
ncbi:MAG: energy transducer TonB [Terracidiphilus sp.]